MTILGGQLLFALEASLLRRHLGVKESSLPVQLSLGLGKLFMALLFLRVIVAGLGRSSL
jgi:hypothetical protein